MDYNNQINNGTNQMYNGVPNQYQPGAPAPNPNNGMAIGSLVCGIVGILLCCCCGMGAILGIVGIVLAICSRKPNGGKMSGMAIAGLVCSIIAILFGAGSLIYSVIGGGAIYNEMMNEFSDIYYY